MQRTNARLRKFSWECKRNVILRIWPKIRAQQKLQHLCCSIKHELSQISNTRQNAIFLSLLHDTSKEQLRTICCHQLFIVTNIDNLLHNSLATLIILTCKSIHKVSKNQESLAKKGTTAVNKRKLYSAMSSSNQLHNRQST